MSLAWVAEQIRAVREASGELGPNLIRFNPNPPGMVRPGSATDAVLAHLREHSGRFFTEAEITQAIGRSHAATRTRAIGATGSKRKQEHNNHERHPETECFSTGAPTGCG